VKAPTRPPRQPPLASVALASFPTCVIARSTSIAALVPTPIDTASRVTESVYTTMVALIYTTAEASTEDASAHERTGREPTHSRPALTINCPFEGGLRWL